MSPKLTFGAFWLRRNTTLFSALIGADVGYQLTVGRFYCAFVFGASVGVGLGDKDIWAGPLNLIPISFVPSEVGFAVGLNPQLLRLGFAF